MTKSGKLQGYQYLQFSKNTRLLTVFVILLDKVVLIG